jgi:HAD superfamily hydrolase (TIGR01509 family)
VTLLLLCDADGNLFPSEEPAFEASARITNRFLEAHGIPRRYTAAELRLTTTGKNFRTTAADLAAAAGVIVPRDELEHWVTEEKRAVTVHLARALRPDPRVTAPLRRLVRRHPLAAVSSSASARLDACFEATGLADLFPPSVRFSAEDSLREPRSKPDPAIYAFAADELGIAAAEALAVEDSVPGVQSAVGARVRTIGNVMFVPSDERAERGRALKAAGADEVIDSWSALEGLLDA